MVGTWCFLCQRAKCEHTEAVREGRPIYYEPVAYVANSYDLNVWNEEQLAERIASRRIIPPMVARKLQSVLRISVLIRWMAKALIGGQK